MMNKTARGMTFVEVLITVGIFGIIMIAIVDSVLSFYRANTSSIEQEYQVEHARKGAELIIRDIREATYADTGAYPLVMVTPSTIMFYSDTDSDGSIERIRYQLVGTTLYRNVTDSSGSPPAYTGGGATTTVSQFIRNNDEGVALFRYYDAANAEVTDPNSIATIVSVTASMIVDITQQHTPGKFTLKSSATLRNLRAQ
jgi:Tfp pilus assembly protein PilW